MTELKPCPFCGVPIWIRKGVYPNHLSYIEPAGDHDDECPLSMVVWHIPMEDGWTETALAQSWNRRENFGY